jgi:hypothetical protein
MPDQNYELEAYLKRPLPDLMSELSLYDAATRSPADTWQKIAGPVRQRICDEWNWCEIRQDPRLENDYELGVAILIVLTTRVLHLPLDVDLALIAAILVKRGLDAFCGCP